jgi:hypothetical protein
MRDFNPMAKPTEKIVPFKERIENALEEAGIDPADWTDEEIGGPEGQEAWREFADNDIRQAGRMEWTRRRRERGELDENGYSGIWLR